MEFEVSYSLDNEQQFWDELDDIVSAKCETHESIDNALRTYLSFTTNYKNEYLQAEYDIARCSYKLLESSVFQANKEYVRRQIAFCLLQEDSPDVLHLIAAFLLFDGKENEETFETMNDEGAFPKLVDLIRQAPGGDADLHRLLLQLLYEMSRIQRIKYQELMLVEDDFVTYLLQIIEELSGDASDPYHYPVIRVLLVLNEQYMVSAHSPSSTANPPPPLANKVIAALSSHGPSYKTFGANLILLLNRESETSPQLLILKLLYLLFTTPATREYFYTNDLRVLVDVVVRNLLDLPRSATALRHTYLRVLYPLLAHSQLRLPDQHYKRREIRQALRLAAGCRVDSRVDGDGDGDNDGDGDAHFGAVDETTRRLGARCAQVPWLRDDDEAHGAVANGNGASANGTPAKPNNKLLGISLDAKTGASSLSVVEVAAHRAKPGEQTPSRGRELEQAQRKAAAAADPAEAHRANGSTKGNGVGPAGEVPVVVLQSPFEVET